METKNKKKKIVVIIVAVLLIALVISAATLFTIYKIKKKNNPQNEATNVSQVIGSYDFITNHFHNDSITSKQLTTTNYRGEYILHSVLAIDFNRETLDEDGIQRLFERYGCRYGYMDDFINYIYNRRKFEYGDVIKITRNSDGEGDVNSYASFTISSTKYKYKGFGGKLYGDDNLAVAEFDESFDSNCFINNKNDKSIFISYNFGTMAEANITLGTNKSNSSRIYVFENVYSAAPEAPPNYRLFTVTYVFERIEQPKSDFSYFN